ncbi:MAG: hypothetical protein LBJ00_06970 [Planctomycetaceae bacterium]|nr:hypothetical protein [Planctomycetaceae bacterium]
MRGLRREGNPPQYYISPAHTDCVPAHIDCAPAHTDCAPAHIDCAPAHTDCAPAHTDSDPEITHGGCAGAPVGVATDIPNSPVFKIENFASYVLSTGPYIDLNCCYARVHIRSFR